ncbi:MAG: asparaginase [Anaerolineales bacterium]|nr:asparaginase [Anaerolineales bacterium]
MPASPYLPAFEFTRGETVESIHNGAIAVVDVKGNLVAWYGDPGAVTFLRSTAKPFQALPFIEHGGQEAYYLTAREIAILCASHSGTDEHVAVVQAVQAKTGVLESELLCGVHDPYHKPTAMALLERNEKPTPNRHNCSGKHTGMLAFVKMGGRFAADLAYIDLAHPLQEEILRTFAEMCDLSVAQVGVGIDGCSAPNFAAPLRNAALAYARLCDPDAGGVAPGERVAACKKIVSAMTSNPDMIGGPGRFDTRLMQVTQGRLVAKGGAEGYQGVGLMPGALGPGSPAMGIALKIGDGDARNKACSAVVMETLRQMGALSEDELEALSEFGPRLLVHNWRMVVVGKAYPTFDLARAA